MKPEDAAGEEPVALEKTLAMIKPDAVDKAEVIEGIIRNEGFQILQRESFKQLSREQASELCAEHVEKAYFQDLLDYVTSGPVVVLVLSSENAIEKWKNLIGPTNVLEAKTLQPESLRAKYGSGEFKNAVHGSSNNVCAEREIALFFPETMGTSTVTGQAAKAYLADNINPVLLKGLTELCKEKPQDPIVWLADWLLINNPNRPTKSNSDDDQQDN